MTKPFLRSTRCGWMRFMEADKAAAAAAGAAAEPTAPQALDYKAVLLDLLGLSADATDEQVNQATAAEKEIIAAAGAETPGEDLSAKITDLQSQLEAKQQEVEKAYQDMNTLRQQQNEAQADSILEQFSDRLTDDKAKARIRAILLSDREAGMDILKALSVPAAPAKADATPPGPTHKPPGQGDGKDQMTDEQKVSEQNTLIAQIRKEGKFSDYSSAREEARRQKPELFS